MNQCVRLVAVLPLVLCGCQETEAPPLPATVEVRDLPDERVLELFGGESGWKPLVQPMRVEAYRVETNYSALEADAEPAPDTRPTLAGYPIISGPVEVDADTASRLTRVLREPDGYGWDYAKACGFDPGVGIRFVGVEGTTEVLLCFVCDNLEFVHNGKRVGFEDTDDIRKPLVRIVQAILPDDAVIQGLKTTR